MADPLLVARVFVFTEGAHIPWNCLLYNSHKTDPFFPSPFKYSQSPFGVKPNRNSAFARSPKKNTNGKYENVIFEILRAGIHPYDFARHLILPRQ